MPWERLLWSGRSLLFPRCRYTLTDLRLVCDAGDSAQEIAVRHIDDVQRTQSWLDRRLGTSTLIVHASGRRRQTLELRHVRRGAQLAALLEILSTTPHRSLDLQAVNAALSWEPRAPSAGYADALTGLAVVLLVALFAVTIGMHRTSAAIVYPPDDAVYPRGLKRDVAEIVRFMETEVMPWAREVLGPLKGGAAQVTCETCHGADPESRQWQMPAVAALPEPLVRERGWERHGGSMDAQVRNAIYGYVAESDKQTKAAYMRDRVMPGMARLLHRPPYDFTRTYEYNRTRFAFGCYHCHRVK
jgi:cytochrome c553